MDLIPCLKHDNLHYNWIYTGKEYTKVFCDYCVDQNSLIDKEQKISKLIHINSVLDQPETILRKLNFQKCYQVFSNKFLSDNSQLINEQVNDLEKQIQNIQEWISQIQMYLKNLVTNIQKLRVVLIEDVLKNLNFEELKNILLSFNTIKETINEENLELIQKNLHKYFQNLNKDSYLGFQNKLSIKVKELQGTIEKDLIEIHNQEKMQQNIKKLYSDFLNLSSLVFPKLFDRIASNLINTHQNEKLYKYIQEITKRQIEEVKLLYVGSKDGLNLQTFWQKVNGKQNLLMIFQSKSNYVFGGYSPCQWSQNIQSYVADNKSQSFLFSQNHNEIYPIKSDKVGNAIYCYSTYGPTFGSGHDIYIASDFQGGSSNLGNSYQWDKTQNPSSSHLFGQSTPNLKECEIFEIIFMK